MPLDPSISLAYQPTQAPVNPFAIAMQASQLQAQQENTRGLAEQRRLLAEQRQNALNDQKSLDNAVKPGAGLEDILAQLPGHMHASVTKQWGDADKAASDAREAKAKAATTEADYLGTLAATVKSYNYDPQAAAIVLSHAKAQGHDTSQIEQLIGQDPSKLPAVVDSLIAASPKQRELADKEKGTQTAADKFAVERPGLVADAAVKAQVAAGTVGGLTPEQQQQSKDRAATNQIAAGNLGVARAREQREAAQAKIAAGDVTDLSPAGLDAAATMFAKSGQLPALGNGDKNTRKKIINRAAELMPGLDVASAKADYHANTQSLSNIGGTLDTLESFSKAARKNLDQFVGLASKLPDTGVPWANTPLRLLNDKMVGAEYMPAVNAARAVAMREVARITGDPKLKGVLSDAARTEVNELVPADITLAQLKRVIPVLLADMDNVHSTLSDQKQAIQDRIKLAGPQSGTSTPAPAAGGFRVTEIK